MEQALRFFKDYEVLIYLGLGIVTIWQIRKFFLAWEELREAAFGLERESAQSRLNRAASYLVFLLVLAVGEFVLVSMIIPTMPNATPLFTPTLDLLATPTTTLSVITTQAPVATTVSAIITSAESSGCISGEVEITSPINGETVRDIVEIIGSANIPNFGFYKFEITRPNEANWLPIQAGDKPVTDSTLGFWDTTRFPLQDYYLRLVVVDNQGQSMDPCIIQINVGAPLER